MKEEHSTWISYPLDTFWAVYLDLLLFSYSEADDLHTVPQVLFLQENQGTLDKPRVKKMHMFIVFKTFQFSIFNLI